MFDVNEIVPVTKFSRNIGKYLVKLRQEDKNYVLIKNNKPQAIVLPIEVYEQLLDEIENKEIMEQIKDRVSLPKSEYLSEEEFFKDFLD